MPMPDIERLARVGDLSAAGFTLRPHGWERRFTIHPTNPEKTKEFILYLFDDEGGAGAYGIIKDADGEFTPQAFDTWCFRLAFLDKPVYREVSAIIEQLIANGYIQEAAP